MSTNAISVSNVKYNYGDILAVQGISFDVQEGEIFGFLGPNGAGKSTTIKMLTGQLLPKHGSIFILGLDVTKNSEKVQAQIGICFERTNLYEQMSAVENLNLFANLYGVKKSKVGKLLDRVGLTGREKDRVTSFSKWF